LSWWTDIGDLCSGVVVCSVSMVGGAREEGGRDN